MKYTDFRIGNYISVTEKARKEFFEDTTEILDVRLEVSTISKDEIRIIHDGNEVEFNYNQIIPFEINEEWLSAYGFEMSYQNKKAQIGCFILSKGVDSWRLYWQFGDNQIFLDRKLKFIHELQNIFKELTTYELSL